MSWWLFKISFLLAILLFLLVQCYFSNQIYCHRWLIFPLASRSLVSLVLAKKESINDIFEQLRWIINGFRVTSEYMGICKRTHEFILMEQLALYRACRVQGVRQGFKLFFFLDNVHCWNGRNLSCLGCTKDFATMGSDTLVFIHMSEIE